MPVLNLTIRHGRTLEEARQGLEQAVSQVSGRFGLLIRKVEWSSGDRVKLEGIGLWVEMWVDAEAVHATGDIPFVSGLLGRSPGLALREIIGQAFPKKLR